MIRTVAAFRGAEFFVDQAEFSGGRQVVLHEFPGSERPPSSEDLGIRGRAFPVEGYVLGAEFEAAKTALLTALEVSGPGELSHPSFGTRRVVVASFRIRESRNESRIARFSIEFREVSPLQEPTVSVDTRSNLLTSADAVRSAAGSQFLEVFDAAMSARDSVVGVLQSASQRVGSVLLRVDAGAQELAQISARVTSLRNQAASIGRVPDQLLAAFRGLFEAVGDAVLTSVALADPTGTVLKLLEFDPGIAPPATTPGRVAELASFDGLRHLVQRLVLAEAARVVADQEFATYDEALRVRSALADAVDEHTEAVSDDTYPALVSLRSAVVLAVPGPDSDLPRIQRFTPPVTLPSLVLAHQLYGSVDRESEIVERNRVQNPGFVRSGVALEVLTRD